MRGPLHVGKLDRQGRLNAVIPGVDQLSNRRFLIDTGTSYSIFPQHSSATPSGPSLRSAGRSTYSLLGGKDPGFIFSQKEVFVDIFTRSRLLPDYWGRFPQTPPADGESTAKTLVDRQSKECFATVSTPMPAQPPTLTPAASSSVTGLLMHRPPQSPASSVTDLLSHRPLLSSIPVRWPRPQRERTGMHSCWRWSTDVGGFLGSPLEMWSTTLTPGDNCWPAY